MIRVTIIMEGCIPAMYTVYSRNAYAVSLPGLVSQLKSKEYTKEIWKELPKLQTASSTPLSIGGSLLVVGGKNEYREVVTAIHLYQPAPGESMVEGRSVLY